MTHLVERFSTASLLPADTVARVLRPSLRTVEVHWHDYYELSLVVSGTAVHVVNGESSVIGPGSAFLLSPADLHSIHPVDDEPLDCFNTVIDPRVVEEHLGSVTTGDAPALPWQADDFAHAEGDLRRLQQETDSPRWGGEAVRQALVTCLLVELARRSGAGGSGGSAGPPAPAVDLPLRDAVLFVDRHFREPVTLADAAARAHLSPNYFSERFRAQVGVTFQRYLQERRLQFARSLLASTSLSVTEVCHAAGFNSLSHFGRVYRRRYGRAPSRGVAAGDARLGDVTM